MKKQSQLTEKTRNNLINSFWKLYKSNNTDKIKIADICNQADYDRTTFYRYFNDIEDIIDQLENEIINSIRTSINDSNSKDKTTSILYEGFERFSNSYGEYLYVFNEKGNNSFYNKFKSLIKNDVYNYLNVNIKDENKKEFAYEFMFSSLINSYCYWYKHKNDIELSEFVEFANSILYNGINSIIKFKQK